MDFFSDEYYMKMALAEAEEALMQNEVPIGAVIVLNDKIIGRGHNLTQNLHDVSAHCRNASHYRSSQFFGRKVFE